MDANLYKFYLSDLRTLLNKHDPVHLIDAGAPESEYDLERSPTAARLAKCNSVEEVLGMVHGVFCEMFDESTAGEKTNYDALAEDLWQLKIKYFSRME